MKCDFCKDEIGVICTRCGNGNIDWQSRAEKAEAELSLIKSRLQGITLEKIQEIMFEENDEWKSSKKIHKLISEVAK